MSIKTAWIVIALIGGCAMPLFAEEGATTSAVPVAPAEAPSISAEDAYVQLISGRTLDASQRTAIDAIIRSRASEEPNELRWKLALAILQRLSGQPNECLKSIQQLAKSYPKSAEVANQLGQAYMATITGDMGMLKMADIAGEARDAWERAIEIDPNHVMARYALAQYQIQARKQGGWLFGSYSKARAHGEYLVKLSSPEGPFWGHLTLASLAAAEEEWADMSRHFIAAETKAPSALLRSMALSMHGSALLRDMKDAKAALPLIERALAEAEPNNTSILYQRGSARKEVGDCLGAVEDFLRVLEVNPEAQNTRILIAQCYESLNEPAEALTHYREYAAQFPKGNRIAEAQSAIKRLQRG